MLPNIGGRKMRQEFRATKSMAKVFRLAFTLVVALGLAKADEFKILDATDYGGSVSVVSMNPARLMITQNNSAGLSAILLPPSPTAVFVSDNCPLGQIGCEHVNVGEYPINPDPNLDFESDVFEVASALLARFNHMM